MVQRGDSYSYIIVVDVKHPFFVIFYSLRWITQNCLIKSIPLVRFKSFARHFIRVILYGFSQKQEPICGTTKNKRYIVHRSQVTSEFFWGMYQGEIDIYMNMEN